ncbi:penicillin-binding transpeptidase domain-containing protein [Pseudonocardia xinjiangensis]|uniref:penicillin-binding transpeptidase domain-containing protein n=1 Tax=Pseudonocardia xinjiangensis TaxID=75289 RepID=UPI003D9157ED
MLRTTQRRRTTTVAAALSATILALTTSCSLLTGPSAAESAVEQFVTALERADVAAAAAATDDPAAATQTITGVLDGLGHPRLTADVREVADERFSYQVSWDLGAGRTWSYLAHGALEADGGERHVRWAPSVLHDELRAGEHLELRTLRTAAARVVDRDGRPLVRTQPVTLVRLDPARTQDLDATLDAVAPVLARVDPGVTRSSLRAVLASGTAGPTTLITLREDDAARVEQSLRAIPGIVFSSQQRRLTERGVRSPALSQLTQEQPDDAGSGWQVGTVTPDGTLRARLAGEDPRPAPDVRLTLDLDAQSAAQNAVNGLDGAAALVAIRPSTGELLAVAQNEAADAEGPIALTGLYPPGSTFKVITATAALRAGLATPDTVLPCPGTENVQGRQIPNDDQFDLGSVPLHTAFAHSCNTTFARLGVGLDPSAFSTTAALFGLGPDWDVPGMTTVTGRVPEPVSPADQVEESIGQGRVVASPFGMALVAATAAAGRTPHPTLIQGRPGTTATAPEALPENLRTQLAAMMRETVTAGSATQLAGLPDTRGKTGTAQYGDGVHSHGWFIGTRGDLAFAVLAAGAGSSGPAVGVAKAYLTATAAR